MELYTCTKCGLKSTPDVFSRKTKCKKCHNEDCKKWAKDNPEKIKAYYNRAHVKKGKLSMSKNKDCSTYLGIYVAERVLSKVFKKVKRMPNNNPGFDFICGMGYKIDVKSSCMFNGKWGAPYWNFKINKNKVADYFLCLAFDNRKNLNPMYMWLIPGDDINDFVGIGTSLSMIDKWDKYALDINKVSVCCDVVKGKHV